MKYKISLVLIFSCIISVFGSEKEVVAFNLIFNSAVDKDLLGKLLEKEKIEKILKKRTNNSKKEIKYKIIFENGSFKDGILKGNFFSLKTEEGIEYILNEILDIFDKKSNQEVDEEFKKIKQNYLEENKENWKQEYLNNLKKEKENISNEEKPESALRKKTWRERIKDSGLFFLGAGLGFTVDRYVLKK